jgi:hypothetical protein
MDDDEVFEMVPVRVVLEVHYQLPKDLRKRKYIYGTTIPARCVEIDLDIDPALVFAEAEVIVLDASEVVEVSADWQQLSMLDDGSAG